MSEARAGELRDLCVGYWGAGLAGAHTNIEAFFARLAPSQRGPHRLEKHPAWGWYDRYECALRYAGGPRHRVVARFLAVSRSVCDPARDRAFLRACDVVVFVVDSQRERLGANLECAELLAEQEQSNLSVVRQYNKRDLSNALPVDELDAVLGPSRVPPVLAIASRGVGVLETALLALWCGEN